MHLPPVQLHLENVVVEVLLEVPAEWIGVTKAAAGSLAASGASCDFQVYCRLSQYEPPQGAQYGLIKEYGSNYIGVHNMIYGILLN